MGRFTMKLSEVISSTVVAIAALSPIISFEAVAQDPVQADRAVLCPKGCVTEIKNPEDWDLSLAFGLNATSGNSESSVYSLNALAQKEVLRNLFRFEVTGAKGEQEDVDTGEKEISQEFLRGDIAYKYFLGAEQRAYAGMSVAALYDRIAEIDYRVFLNPALGYYFVKDEDLKFSAEAGPSYVFEEVDEVEDDYLAPRVAERLEWSFSETSKFFQAAEFLFDIDDSDNILINAEAGLEAAIATNLALVFSVKDRFDNVPAEGLKSNDIFYTTALKVRW